ncbi:hypothetical protein GALL_467900 [mine drainage metagenome]|uniref:Oligosaccharide repeat unit polymerase n=1 Tax=mine drainage metagenome TaxID=410659 RepID=A0A1J5PJB7_9ZZZZ
MISAPILLVAYGVWAYLFSNSDERLLLNPIFLSFAILLAMVEYFWRRDRHLPIVDVGVLCAVITLIYMAVPTIFYIKSGYHWSSLSDPRFLQMGTTPNDVAGVGWYVTAYLAAFCATYFLLRGDGMPGPDTKIEITSSLGKALLAIFAFAAIYKIGVESYFGINLNPSNRELQANYGVAHLPLIWAQLTHNVLGIGRIAMLGIIAFVFARKDFRFGLALAAWLILEGYVTLSNMGSRTNFVSLIFAAILAWHRLIRPIGPIFSIGGAVLFLGGVLGLGYFRDFGDDLHGVQDIWSAGTEFQIILANGLHVAWAHAHGLITQVPWQITFNDIILAIPQQLLPFQKLDMEHWYIRETGLDTHGLGLMFGVVAQSELGFGLPEIIVRGAVLGAVLALIHRQCVKHATNLTVFILYLWLCTSIYYTYRASTFYIATWAIYRVIPFVLLFQFLSWLLRPRTGADIVAGPET